MSETFEKIGISDGLINGLLKEKISVPTEVQERVIPLALKNMDLIAQSGTGTGKTLAYLLPMYEKINAEIKEMQAIVLTPTHELAVQILRQIERLSANSGKVIKGATIIGNVNIDRQIEKLKEKPHILVGTSGRILELIKKRKISAHTIKTIVIDEVDRMMDKTNIENVKAVIKSTLKERQLMAFSATIHKQIEESLKSVMKEPETIRINEKLTVADGIEHFYFITEQRDKIEVLRKLLRSINPSKAIVFLNNQGNEIEIFTDKLRYHGLNVMGIHGTTDKLSRKKAMDDFRAGRLPVLLASDIAARGLHIENVTHVFNVYIPEDVKDYIHRVGRTARNGKNGMSLSVATQREVQFLKNFGNTLGIEFKRKDIIKGKIVDK